MTTKHTPGPWRACKDGKCKCGQVWSITADYPVATVQTGTEWGDEWWEAEQQEDGEWKSVRRFMPYGYMSESAGHANARLIAAAPELLEALQRSAEAWENAVEMGIIPPQHKTAAEILALEARAAIAKATGEAA